MHKPIISYLHISSFLSLPFFLSPSLSIPIYSDDPASFRSNKGIFFTFYVYCTGCNEWWDPNHQPFRFSSFHLIRTHNTYVNFFELSLLSFSCLLVHTAKAFQKRKRNATFGMRGRKMIVLPFQVPLPKSLSFPFRMPEREERKSFLGRRKVFCSCQPLLSPLGRREEGPKRSLGD